MTDDDIKIDLEQLKRKFSALMAMFEHPDHDLSTISDSYSELKKQVQQRLLDLQLLEKHNKLNKGQKGILLRCVNEVSLHCSARIGSKNKGELSSSIYDGKDYCAYWLSQLAAKPEF